MPDTKISADSAATSTTGVELAGIQGGGNVRVPAGLIQRSVRLSAVTQAAHGFVAGDAVKLNGTTWSKAIGATSVANATVIAVVESSTTNTFIPVLAGWIGLSGLTAGIYYLSDVTAGLLTLTAPTPNGPPATNYLVPVMRAVSATEAYVDISTPLSLSLIQESDLGFYGAEVSVAAAGTTDVGAAASRHVFVTGAATITGFGTAPAGRRRDLRFEGVCTLTNNVTSLILPNGGSNITTAAGDRMGLLSLGSGNWLAFWYQRADGTSLAGGGVGSGDVTAAAAFGVDLALIIADGTGKGVKSEPKVGVNSSGDLVVKGDGVQGSVTLAAAHATDPKSISITVPATITNPYRLVLPGVIPTVGQGLRVASIAGDVVTLEHATPVVLPALSALTFASTLDLAFTDAFQRRSLAMTGNLTLTGSGYADKRKLQVFVAGDTVTRTIAVPSGWIPIGVAVTELAANKNAVLSLECTTGAESGVRYGWGVQP